MRYYGRVSIRFNICADSEEQLYEKLEDMLVNDGIDIKLIDIDDQEEEQDEWDEADRRYDESRQTVD